jgi:hypothetical protein
MKIRVLPFQVGKNAVDKISLVEFPSVWEDAEHDEFASDKKMVVIVFLVSMTCRVLRMISVGDRANIFESGWEYGTRARHLL